jgi:hypothetical protein
MESEAGIYFEACSAGAAYMGSAPRLVMAVFGAYVCSEAGSVVKGSAFLNRA